MNKLRPWHKLALAGVGYAFLVLLMTWPAIASLSERLIGNNEDTWIFFWNNWWLREALSGDLNLFFTPHLFFPQGASLVAHSNSYLSSILAVIIDPLVGPVASYNLVFLFGLWVGAVGMYLLVEDITEQPIAAFIAGFVFAFAPYHRISLSSQLPLLSLDLFLPSPPITYPKPWLMPTWVQSTGGHSSPYFSGEL